MKEPTNNLPVRVTASELEQLRRKAGKKTLAVWVRHRLGLKPPTMGRPKKADPT